MKLDEIVVQVAATSGLKAGELKKAVNGIFAAIKTAVEQGEKVSISGMGSFILKSREAGEKIDAKTGETRATEASRFIAFKPSKVGADKEGKEKKRKKA